jgi:hypothetical protein
VLQHVNTPQRRRIPGPTPNLATEVWVEVAPLDGSAVYHLVQGNSTITLTHEMAMAVASELMDAHDEEERRQAAL